MYSFINQHIELLLAELKPKKHINPYIDICRSFDRGDRLDAEFQDTYKKYFGMNAARPSERFLVKYFDLLDLSRGGRSVDVIEVTKELRNYSPAKDETAKVHLSFATKLAHMIDRTYPIFDSTVSAFFYLPGANGLKGAEKKYVRHKSNYEFLRKEYRRIIAESLLSPSISCFRQKYPDAIHYTDEKIIDTLIWRFAAYLKSGALQKGSIFYS